MQVTGRRPGRPFRPGGVGAGGDLDASKASPSTMAAGAGGGERARLWWYSALSTHYIGT